MRLERLNVDECDTGATPWRGVSNDDDWCPPIRRVAGCDSIVPDQIENGVVAEAVRLRRRGAQPSLHG
jgi:hypothetical protein